MNREIEAIYENGLLRPLEPLDLGEQQRVRVTVQSTDDWQDEDAVQWAAREGDPSVTLEQVRGILAKLKGNLAETIIAERGEY